MGFQNKTAVITGGALGIGRCLTRAFADAGCRIAFFDCGQRAGEENLNFLQRTGKDALFFCGNGEAPEALEAFVQKTINTYGNIDYLINNMCINRGGLLTPCGYEDFLAVLKVGVAAPYYLTQRFLPYFNSGGCVVNLSSTRAVQSQENTESYTAAKGGRRRPDPRYGGQPGGPGSGERHRPRLDRHRRLLSGGLCSRGFSCGPEAASIRKNRRAGGYRPGRRCFYATRKTALSMGKPSQWMAA